MIQDKDNVLFICAPKTAKQLIEQLIEKGDTKADSIVVTGIVDDDCILVAKVDDFINFLSSDDVIVYNADEEEK